MSAADEAWSLTLRNSIARRVCDRVFPVYMASAIARCPSKPSDIAIAR
jgi:hypothetical protein